MASTVKRIQKKTRRGYSPAMLIKGLPDSNRPWIANSRKYLAKQLRGKKYGWSPKGTPL